VDGVKKAREHTEDKQKRAHIFPEYPARDIDQPYADHTDHKQWDHPEFPTKQNRFHCKTYVRDSDDRQHEHIHN
jgi:hypothetical protein